MRTKTHSIGIEESILGEGYKLIIQDLNNKYATVEIDLDDEELDRLSELIRSIRKVKISDWVDIPNGTIRIFNEEKELRFGENGLNNVKNAY